MSDNQQRRDFTFAHDFAFLYVDLGDPWWPAAVTEMLRSVIRVMPDARIVQLTDRDTKQHPWVDHVVRANIACPADSLSQFKAYIVEDYLAATPHNAIISDADTIWLARPTMLDGGACAYDPQADALPWRQFYMQAGQAPQRVWRVGFKEFTDALPPSTHRADAFELALNFGMPERNNPMHAATPDQTTAFVMHFPGPENRQRMTEFARSIDGGEPFKEMDPSYVAPPKTGVNEDLGSISFEGAVAPV